MRPPPTRSNQSPAEISHTHTPDPRDAPQSGPKQSPGASPRSPPARPQPPHWPDSRGTGVSPGSEAPPPNPGSVSPSPAPARSRSLANGAQTRFSAFPGQARPRRTGRARRRPRAPRGSTQARAQLVGLRVRPTYRAPGGSSGALRCGFS